MGGHARERSEGNHVVAPSSRRRYSGGSGKGLQEGYRIRGPENVRRISAAAEGRRRGNRYYRVPRGAAGIVRIVDRARMEAVPAIQVEGLTTQVQAYAEAVESRPAGDRAPGHWRGSDELMLRRRPVQAKRCWCRRPTILTGGLMKATGRRRFGRMRSGHMLVGVPPGAHTIRMVFETPRKWSRDERRGRFVCW